LFYTGFRFIQGSVKTYSLYIVLRSHYYITNTAVLLKKQMVADVWEKTFFIAYEGGRWVGENILYYFDYDTKQI
jgi:hypothetical protein